MNSTKRAGWATLGFTLIGALLQGCGGGGGGGTPTATPTPTPSPTPTPTSISALAAGGAANCRIAASGSATACWGQNDVGQLGIGNTTTTDSPTPITFPGGLTAKQVAQGVEHACAILADDTVACWGDNAAGQLGQDPATTPQSATPLLVAGIAGTKSVTVGLSHSCIVTASNAVQCWGGNAKGQLGQATAGLVATPLPQTIAGLSAKAIGSGFNHVCAIQADDSVACWGDNQYGQLGHGDNADSPTPVAALGLSGVLALSVGADHTCAATGAETRCWGRNDAGQLGSNGSTDRNTPTATQSPLAGVVALAAGQSHTCALTASAVECWGSNASKQLSGNTSGGNTRVTATLAAAPKALSAGLNHTCAQDADNATWCWGAGSMGRLGPNAGADSAVAVRVP